MIFVLRVIMAASFCGFIFLLINYVVRRKLSYREDDKDV